MLEIILLIGLCKHLGGLVRAKGRTAWPFQLMLVVFWFGGEFMAGIVAGVVYAIRNGGVPETQFNLWLYGVALAGAGLGAGLAYLIVSLLSPVRSLPEPTFPATGDFGAPSMDSDNPYASPRNL